MVLKKTRRRRARPPSLVCSSQTLARTILSSLSLLSLSSILFSPPIEHVERVSSLSGGRHLCRKEVESGRRGKQLEDLKNGIESERVRGSGKAK